MAFSNRFVASQSPTVRIFPWGEGGHGRRRRRKEVMTAVVALVAAIPSAAVVKVVMASLCEQRLAWGLALGLCRASVTSE